MGSLREGLCALLKNTNPVPQVTSPVSNPGQTSRRQERSSEATRKSEPSPVPVYTIASNHWPELGAELHGTRCETEILVSAGQSISVPPHRTVLTVPEKL